MRRTLIVGAAWLSVTAVSILVAYAAVGEVRDRVVDQPRLLSVAASTVTSSTTPTSTVVPMTSSDDPVGPSTTVPSATSTSAVSGTSTTAGTSGTTTSTAQGRIETYSTPGGSVSIEVFPDRLRLLGAVPAAGFSVAEQEIAPTKIEIEFKSSSQEVHFHAELQGDGEVDIDVETENE